MYEKDVLAKEILAEAITMRVKRKNRLVERMKVLTDQKEKLLAR
jgi:hypothetical protein